MQGRRVEQAIERFHLFLDERGLHAEQIGPRRFLVEGEILWSPPSGRIRVKGQKTYPAKGLFALAELVTEKAMGLSQLYPPSLSRVGDNTPSLMAAYQDPLERQWATAIVARALRVARTVRSD